MDNQEEHGAPISSGWASSESTTTSDKAARSTAISGNGRPPSEGFGKRLANAVASARKRLVRTAMDDLKQRFRQRTQGKSSSGATVLILCASHRFCEVPPEFTWVTRSSGSPHGAHENLPTVQTSADHGDRCRGTR